MTPMPDETSAIQPIDETPEFVKPDISRQISLKRHNSDKDLKVCELFLPAQIRT